MADIEAARNILKSTLKKSRDLNIQINKTGVSLLESRQRLPHLESAFKSIGEKCFLLTIKGQIDRVVGPAAAVVKVFGVVKNLELSLLKSSCYDLFHYLTLVKQLEEALRFLTSNSRLVICWLEDVLNFFEKNKFENDRYLSSVRKCVSILRELHAMEQISRLKGPLFISLNKLETQFQLILTENTFPISFSSTSDMEKGSISAHNLPASVIQKLQAIIERLNVNNRMDKCVSIYIQVRSSNTILTIKSLELDYLDLSLSEFESVQSIENYIDQWGIHLEFIIKHVLELEYKLFSEVFGSKTWMNCFSEIAVKSGIQNFIKFGSNITKGKKDAVKLLKLLEIFGVLNKLRLDFNRVFSGTSCIEIKNQTRDLIKKIVNGACEIFHELFIQVELQKESTPPTDGSVTRLISFVTEFCNELLEDDYKVILIQVLEIKMSWENRILEEGFVTKEIYKIMTEIERNLEIWVKKYEDTALSYLFMMNSHCYFSKNLKGTKVGDLMGESWLKTHEQAMENYAAIYLRESWGKLPLLLSEKRLEDFNTGFDDIYKKQCKWVVSDKRLRNKICDVVVEILVPVYRNYVEYYHMGMVEQGMSTNTFVKYSAEALEDMVNCLFQPNIGKYSRSRNTNKCTQLVGNIRNVASTHFSSTPAAARVF